MRTFLAFHSQTVVIMIKRFDKVIRSRELTLKVAYPAFDQTNFVKKWSRHLEDYNDVLFVDANDPIKSNPFNPFKRVIKLLDMDEGRIVHNVIGAFNEEEFDKVVYFCLVDGLQESYLMIPDTAGRVADALVALRALDRRTEKEVRQEARYSTEKSTTSEAAKDSQILGKI